jgi:NADPH-dependent glutamate synthase beta subunit-like oxidoreductase
MNLDDLLKNHDYLFLAIGAWLPVTLGIPGEEDGLVGLDILHRIKNGEKFDLGKVGVIGGGNTAFDVARCLKRLGNDVKIYYRRRVEDMPAEPENHVEAVEEGIEITPLTTPMGIVKNNVIMSKTHCVGGRQSKLEIIKGSEFDVKMDSVVMAIGQKPDTKFLADHLKIDHLDRILAKNGRTSHPRIFAGGDAVLGAMTLAHAVGEGLQAAETLDFHVRRIPAVFRFLARDKFLPKSLRQLKFSPEHRIKITHREVAKRIKDFKMTEQPIPAEQYTVEANRCLTCPLKYRP